MVVESRFVFRECKRCNAQFQTFVLFCAHCDTLIPFQSYSPFFVFNIPASFFPNMDIVESKYFELLKQIHPDRVRNLEGLEQEESVLYAGLVNDCYKTLKSPNLRIIAILEKLGAEVPVLEVSFLSLVMELESKKQMLEISSIRQDLEQMLEQAITSSDLKQIGILVAKLKCLYRIQV